MNKYTFLLYDERDHRAGTLSVEARNHREADSKADQWLLKHPGYNISQDYTVTPLKQSVRRMNVHL